MISATLSPVTLDDLELELTVRMPVSDWRHLMRQVGPGIQGHAFSSMIASMLGNVTNALTSAQEVGE